MVSWNLRISARANLALVTRAFPEPFWSLRISARANLMLVTCAFPGPSGSLRISARDNLTLLTCFAFAWLALAADCGDRASTLAPLTAAPWPTSLPQIDWSSAASSLLLRGASTLVPLTAAPWPTSLPQIDWSSVASSLLLHCREFRGPAQR